MGQPPQIFCIHRNRLLRQSLAQALATSSELDRFAAIEVDPNDAEQMLNGANDQPHVALLDLSLNEWTAVRLTEQCVQHNIHVVLLVSVVEPDGEQFSSLVHCVAAGARGYLLEDASVSEVVRAINTVSQGEHYCSSAIFDQLMGQLVKLSADSSRPVVAEPRKLTDRELLILHWIGKGCSNKEVAKKLRLSIYTVKNHVHRILNKLNASDRAHAVQHATKANWIPLPEELALAESE